jgi:hypothetical protein
MKRREKQEEEQRCRQQRRQAQQQAKEEARAEKKAKKAAKKENPMVEVVPSPSGKHRVKRVRKKGIQDRNHRVSWRSWRRCGPTARTISTLNLGRRVPIHAPL